jgi:hypothetical protein
MRSSTAVLVAGMELPAPCRKTIDLEGPDRSARFVILKRLKIV